MSKRAPTSTLNHDNWNEEYKAEDSGSFQRATQSTLKERVIMKARRKRHTESNNGASAFSGMKFSSGTTQDTPTDSSVATNDPELKEGQISNAQENKENQEEETVTETVTVTNNGDHEVSNLNIALLKWIEKHINENAVCDLRPIFDDYKTHMERIDKKYGTSWTETDTEVETVDAGDVKDDDKMDPIEDITANEPPPSPPKSEPEVQKDPPKLFAFEKTAPATSTFSGFSASKPDDSTEEIAAPKFLFKPSNPDSSSDKSPPMFSFGKKEPATESIEKPTSFFSKLPAGDAASKPFGGFSFGGSSSNGGGFSFGSNAGSIGSTFKPMSESKPAEEDEYVPPKVEEAEFDDAQDSVYQKKAKVFYSKEGQYKEIGVGQLYVKPLDDNRGSILVRADNTLGNILLNIKIPNVPPPVPVGKNNCLVTTIPNPPIEGIEGPVPILIRVKTAEDRDELIDIIKSKQQTP